MRLPSFLQRQQAARSGATSSRGAVPQDDAAIEQLRVRARRRLIGAAVLVVLAVVVLPMVFESKPRPVGGPITIEGVRPDGTSAAPIAAAPTPVPAPVSPPAASAAPVMSSPVAVVPPAAAARPASAADPVAADPVAALSEPDPPKVAPKPAEKPVEKPAEKPAAKPVVKPEAPKSEPATATVGKPDGVKFAVQVGAYAEANAVRETRARLDKLGLRSSVQPVTTNEGTRTRVRIGPFATREEAEKAAAQLRAAGLPGMIVPQ
ncbi:SPOR domain-containing protein [Sphaerotilus mobilis]|uniref:DedD protein n=1 Tax=Sphaerotilus mobilis TaxID=47994 RepID=A0A4Q7LVG6_9BURK|nr:SPOR domain-containing protein [Sphaerotilus mobilis]RZS58302.1 DedD protein [Sphaerotilus mobilis]